MPSSEIIVDGWGTPINEADPSVQETRDRLRDDTATAVRLASRRRAPEPAPSEPPRGEEERDDSAHTLEEYIEVLAIAARGNPNFASGTVDAWEESALRLAALQRPTGER